MKTLLNKRNFNFKKEVDGQLLSQLCWAHCLSYEYELRKEACKKCRTTTMGIHRSIHSPPTKTTYEDNEHRTQHWVQLMAIANSSKENDAKMAKLEREVQELKNMVGWLRSPRIAAATENLASAASSSSPFTAPLQCQRFSEAAKRGQEGYRQRWKETVVRARQVPPSLVGAVAAVQEELISISSCRWVTKRLRCSTRVTKTSRSASNVQTRQCADPKICNRRHACIGCGTEGKHLQRVFLPAVEAQLSPGASS